MLLHLWATLNKFVCSYPVDLARVLRIIWLGYGGNLDLDVAHAGVIHHFVLNALRTGYLHIFGGREPSQLLI